MANLDCNISIEQITQPYPGYMAYLPLTVPLVTNGEPIVTSGEEITTESVILALELDVTFDQTTGIEVSGISMNLWLSSTPESVSSLAMSLGVMSYFSLSSDNITEVNASFESVSEFSLTAENVSETSFIPATSLRIDSGSATDFFGQIYGVLNLSITIEDMSDVTSEIWRFYGVFDVHQINSVDYDIAILSNMSADIQQMSGDVINITINPRPIDIIIGQETSNNFVLEEIDYRLTLDLFQTSETSLTATVIDVTFEISAEQLSHSVPVFVSDPQLVSIDADNITSVDSPLTSGWTLFLEFGQISYGVDSLIYSLMWMDINFIQRTSQEFIPILRDGSFVMDSAGETSSCYNRAPIDANDLTAEIVGLITVGTTAPESIDNLIIDLTKEWLWGTGNLVYRLEIECSNVSFSKPLFGFLSDMIIDIYQIFDIYLDLTFLNPFCEVECTETSDVYAHLDTVDPFIIYTSQGSYADIRPAWWGNDRCDSWNLSTIYLFLIVDQKLEFDWDQPVARTDCVPVLDIIADFHLYAGNANDILAILLADGLILHLTPGQATDYWGILSGDYEFELFEFQVTDIEIILKFRMPLDVGIGNVSDLYADLTFHDIFLELSVGNEREIYVVLSTDTKILTLEDAQQETDISLKLSHGFALDADNVSDSEQNLSVILYFPELNNEQVTYCYPIPSEILEIGIEQESDRFLFFQVFPNLICVLKLENPNTIELILTGESYLDISLEQVNSSWMFLIFWEEYCEIDIPQPNDIWMKLSLWEILD